MQSKQLYIGRKVLLGGGSKKVQRENKEVERESKHCRTEKCIPKEHFLLGLLKEERK